MTGEHDRLAVAVAAGLPRVRDRISAAGGDPERIRIVAVTKGFGADAPRAALAAGLADLGENYADELAGKAALLADEGLAPRWHFLGAVQRRKVRRIAPFVSQWEGIARAVEGSEIARFSPGASVLVEVETTGLPGRGGVAPAAVRELCAELTDSGVRVEGLMTVAPPGAGAAALRAFEIVSSLADELGLDERSMGMSGDLEEAVRAGTTAIRVGEALFGPRPAQPKLAQ
ncbi:MAG TPA: alanine racemase [Acidimicrobiales bacterium]|nr:alanine racemase [Acidimicrobiales bacterium]